MKPKYPVYVISKGRFDNCLTADFLIKDGTDFKLVVEPQEETDYAERYGRERLYVLPFSNLGLGSIPARNWVWDHSKAGGFKRHWILDDNIFHMYRRFKAHRLPANSGPSLAVMEEFVDRYENIAIAGPNYSFFAMDKTKRAAFYLNNHVYSTLLICNELPIRWRGRYNEDTDLCLQALAAGWCTVLFNAYLIKKAQTMLFKGGNSDELYTGDGRLKMARTLERAWPHVASVKRRFKRPQHVVRDEWKKFDTPLVRRKDIDWQAMPKADELGFKLEQKNEQVKSPFLRKLLDGQEA